MKWLSFSGLRVRLILLVLLAVIPALGLTLYSGLEQRSRARMDAFNSALEIAQKASDDQEGLIESTHQLLIALAQMDQLLKCPSSGDSPFLSNLLKEFPFYTNLGTTGPDGQVICSAVPMKQPTNFADREWFPRIIRNRKFTLSEYLIGRITGKPSIVLSYPILGGPANLRGVVFASIGMDWLNQIAIKAQLPPDSVITVIDRKGTILARYPDPKKWVSQKKPDAPIMKAILSRQGKGTVEIRGIDGVLRLYAFTPLSKRSEVDAYVSVGIPTKVAFAGVNRSLFRNLVLLGLVSILALATAWFIWNLFIIYPVNRLLDATQQLAQGDLTIRTGTLYGSGEIGQLAHSFDQMAEFLEQRETERKQAEEALQDAMAQRERLARHVPGVLYQYRLRSDGTSHFPYASKGIQDIYGVSPEQVVDDATPVFEVLHPDDIARVTETIQASARTLKVWHDEYRVNLPDGHTIWV
ncbi:MAG: HAMP domain-containing protein, partial [Deltaproteobacteria bacterium]|nr:HAMP domain-containing protein [Deltaproteobacteria bacterium]